MPHISLLRLVSVNRDGSPATFPPLTAGKTAAGLPIPAAGDGSWRRRAAATGNTELQACRRALAGRLGSESTPPPVRGRGGWGVSVRSAEG